MVESIDTAKVTGYKRDMTILSRARQAVWYMEAGSTLDRGYPMQIVAICFREATNGTYVEVDGDPAFLWLLLLLPFPDLPLYRSTLETDNMQFSNRNNKNRKKQ